MCHSIGTNNLKSNRHAIWAAAVGDTEGKCVYVRCSQRHPHASSEIAPGLADSEDNKKASTEGTAREPGAGQGPDGWLEFAAR